jgi:predicted AAA+ superfamily ATPase
MKSILSQLNDDFHERQLPALTPREQHLPEVKGKADVVIGMRRAGKTWLCYQKMRELLAAGLEKEKILYLNLEDDRLLEFDIRHFQDMLDVYYGKYPHHRQDVCYFFFDEIQRIDQWEMFIRRLLDTENVRVFLTGSSSKLLSTEIATSLRGRSLTIEIFPFSFKEFLKCHDLFDGKTDKFGAGLSSVLRRAAADYLEIGGFPEVQDVDRSIRIEILQGYVDAVILKDVIERHHIGNVTALRYLVRHIINASGGQFSVNKFYNTMRSLSVKCTKNSLYAYLDHLTDAFVFFKVPIHTHSEKSRLINPAKMYTIDTGLLNAMTFRRSADSGLLLEHMVFLHLRRNGFQVEYVKTKEGCETDFFARQKESGDVKLIQVCWDMSDEHTFNRELRGLNSAMAKLSISSGTIVTWDSEAEIDHRIQVVPVWKWLLS